MRYVAINTAGPIIEALAVYDDKSEYIKLEKVMAAEQLLPALDEMIDKMGLKLSDFDDFVCVVGPGSFTGIRIGVNTVRAFAYALRKNVYGVTYNRVLAYNSNDNAKAVTLVDGGSGVCYVAAYDGDTLAEPICIYKKDAKELCDKYSLAVVADYELDGAEIYRPDGRALKNAAEYAISTGSGTDPLYIRKPQPERKENDI